MVLVVRQGKRSYTEIPLYKKDTNIIATWLAVKARKCGYPTDLLFKNESISHTFAQPAKSQRLKGKARKEAREKTRGNGSDVKAEKVSAAGPAHIIKIKDFISLAEFIAGYTNPVVQVPYPLVKALDRAIQLRTLHNEASRQENSESKATNRKISDKTHSYFLGILERVREILRPRMPPDSSSDVLSEPFEGLKVDNESPKPQLSEQSGNVYEHLELEEPSQDFVDTPAVIRAAGADPNDEPRYEAEVIQSFEEKYIAAHCLFQDIRNICSFLRTLWTNYREKMIELAAASVTTNTAINLVRDMEEEFTQRFPDLTGFENVLKHFFMVQCLHRGEDPDGRQRPDDPLNFNVSVQEIVSPGHAPVYEPGSFGYRDRSTTWAQKSARQKFQDDKLVLMEAFPDLYLFAEATKRHTLAEDDFIRGIRDLGPGYNIPLWVVFAAHAFLDTQHVLEHDLASGHDDLQRIGTLIKESIEENLEFHTSLRVNTWPTQNDMPLRQLISEINRWVLRDLVGEKSKKIRQGYGMPQAVPYSLLRQYPLLCGLLTFALQSRFQDIGVAFANAWGSIMYTAHLYNAVRQEKLLQSSWKDMELVIMMQSSAVLFVGDAPTNLEEYFKRFLLSMGYSATAFASNRRTNVGAMASARGPRSLRGLGKVGKLFGDRYCNNAPTVTFTRESIQPLIDAKTDGGSDDKEEQGKNSSKVKQATSGTLLRKSKRSGTSISTLAFLEDITNALHAEQVELSIDYLLLHRTCWESLRQVNVANKPKLLEMYGGGYLEKENQLPFVVGYILMAATQTKKVANLLLPRRTEEVTSKLLATAGEAIEKFTKSAGDTLVTTLWSDYGYDFDFGELEDHSGSDDL
ncbi:MAG: hypothetical protein Q9209_002506 [Squamulea sp. 1 TL-2023]